MLDPRFKTMLAKQQQPDNIVKLRDRLLQWHSISRAELQKHYPCWDKNLMIYRGERCRDQKDIESADRGEPEKFVVANTYTQVQTFVTFCYMIYSQREYFFELEPTGNEDFSIDDISEKLLSRDLKENKWSQRVIQGLLDVARMGVMCYKSYWKRDMVWVEDPVPAANVTSGYLSATSGGGMVAREVPKYEGNCVMNISPYRMLPDLRLPMSRWDEGQFFADEEELNVSKLFEQERAGLMAGIEFVTPMTKDFWNKTKRQKFVLIDQSFANNQQVSDKDFLCVQTEGQYKLIPKDFDLGPETYPVDFLITMVNDNRIVSIKKANYLHSGFIYDLGQFSPDQHAKLNMALSDTIYGIQDVITWLINSRIVAVKQSIEDKLVVDPSVIDVKNLEARSSIIYVKKGAPRTGISNFIQQINKRDTTVTHFNDAETLMRIMQMVTGVNENAMGQYAPGRRSATENRAANQGAASRMKVCAQLLWDQCFNPMGRKLLTNSRQSISRETFDKVLGVPKDPAKREMEWVLYQPAKPSDLVGNCDFFIFDGTMSTEKLFAAQALQELLVAMMSNPETIGMMGFDPTKIFEEIQTLKGVKNVDRFRFDPADPRLAQPTGLPAIPSGGPAAPGATPAVQENSTPPGLPE